MAKISSPVGQTINVVATTVSRSVIAGGGGGGRGMTPTGGGGGTGVERGGEISVRPQASLIDRAQDLRIQANEQNFSGFQEDLRVINVRVVELNQALNNIAKLIQNETTLEQNQLKQEQESERKSTERKIRIGKESELEKNITAALAAPIVRLQKKVTSIFENIMGAMTTLFMGWLTNQGIETLKALAAGDTKKLNEIKNTIIKNVLLSIGAFVAVKTGFGLLMRTITGLTFRIGGLVSKIITAPFRAAAAGVRSIFSGGGGGGGLKPSAGPKTGPGSKPGPGVKPGKGPGLLGGITSVFGAGMNVKSGEYADSAVSAGGLLPGSIGAIFRGVSLIDDVSEMFGVRGGAGIIGNTPRGGNTQSDQSAPSTSILTTPKVAPQQTMMGTSSQSPTQSTPPVETKPTEIKTQTPMMGQQNNVKLEDLESKLNENSNSYISGMIQEEEYLKTRTDLRNQISEMKSGSQMPNQKTSAEVSAATVQAPPKPQTPVGTLPEPQPNIIMAGGGQDKTQVVPPQQQEPLTDVPFIPSANPDNFYVLYSQLNYNVVM